MENLTAVAFRVYGIPKPQGSKKAFVAGGRAIMKEAAGAGHAAWRNDVATTAAEVARERGDAGPFSGPLAVAVVFRMPRPKSRRRKNGPAYGWHAVAPDLDKLARATFDGLQAGGLILDDSLIASATLCAYETDGWTGAVCQVNCLPPVPPLPPPDAQ